MNRNFKTLAVSTAAAASVVAGSANAAVAEGALDAITSAGADIGIVGGAVFLIMVAIKLIKWVRKAL